MTWCSRSLSREAWTPKQQPFSCIAFRMSVRQSPAALKAVARSNYLGRVPAPPGFEPWCQCYLRMSSFCPSPVIRRFTPGEPVPRSKDQQAIIRVAFRQLGGEPDSPPLAPPWFLPGADAVWQRIVAVELALRALVREVYTARFGKAAAATIEAKLPEQERETLARALRVRPPGSDPLSVVDYLYLGQLPPLVFANDVWQDAKARLNDAANAKQRLQVAVSQIAPVRNEIAHVREVESERLLKATAACGDVLALVRPSTG
jgi:hypothetical protein